MEQRTDDDAFALPHLLARGMGGVARRHADDADLGRGHAAALAARPARHRRRSRRFICRCRACCRSTSRRRSGCSARSSASSAPRTPRCPTSSASPARSRSASRPPRACCRRCSRAGRTCRRSISSPPTAFFSQRGARTRRPDGEEGLSGELRPAGAAALSLRHQGRAAAGARAGLFASRSTT